MTALRSVTGCGSAEWNMTAMSDVKTLSDRIDMLEARLTFQDATIETLNETITAQWHKIDALTRQIAALRERLQQAESHLPGATDEPPPHY
jgi:SlyX protein